jgi:oligopeptide transport system ATP-binding protein
MAILQVRDLEVTIGQTKILRGVSFDLVKGKTLGVVGESGCGKSMTGFTVMGMLPENASISAGSIKFEGKDLTKLSAKEWPRIRGRDLALVMQDPFTCLNPMAKIGDQIAEVLILHRGMKRREAQKHAVEMLYKVGVPAPENSAKKYPHQLSGGQRQRVVIAVAFACRPKVLIADEPTTALDVTLQAQILHLIRELQDEVGTAVMLISHDIGVIASVSSRIAVYYAGKIVEDGSTEDVLRNPAHPYTRALLEAIPSVGRERLAAIKGHPPDLSNLAKGCSFQARCPYKMEACIHEPKLFDAGDAHHAACWLLPSAKEHLPKVSTAK